MRVKNRIEFKKLFDRLGSLISLRKRPGVDEIVGVWENGGEDASGLHALWGWAYEFRKDGTGIHYYWNSDEEEIASNFEWKRIDKNSIAVKFSGSPNWENSNYTITDFIGAYKAKLWKLIDTSYTPNDFTQEGFLGFPGAVYKLKS